MVCSDADFECYNSPSTVVFCFWMPSSCCCTRKHVAVASMGSSFHPFGHNYNDQCVEGPRERNFLVSSELHSCYVDGFVISCCLSFLPSIDPPLIFISALFCCSNSFNCSQPK